MNTPLHHGIQQLQQEAEEPSSPGASLRGLARGGGLAAQVCGVTSGRYVSIAELDFGLQLLPFLLLSD